MQGFPRLASQLRDFILRRALPRNGPFRLWVDITSRCNLKCPACPQRLLPDGQRRDMPDDLLASLVKQVAAGGAREVNLFHRGEPLLHPRIGYWIKSFRQVGAVVRLHSNATLLDQELVDSLLEAAPDIFTCSIDALDPETYATARPGADLERTLHGLELLLAERGRRGLKQPKVSLLLMGRQSRSQESHARLMRLRQLGLDRVVKRAPHNWGGAVGPVVNGKPHTCTFPWYGLAVLSDGRVTPCPQDFFGQIKLGSAFEQPLWDIWQSVEAQNLRSAHAELALDDYPVCLSCDRIRRKTIFGMPLDHLHNFVVESIFGLPGRLRAKPWKK